MLRGIGASAGIGIGRAVLVRQPDLTYDHVTFRGQEAEEKRLSEAVAVFAEQTRTMAERAQARMGRQQAEILLGQIVMIEDPYMMGQMRDRIADGQCAESALDGVCREYVVAFSAMEDALMRQRATDVEDLRARMLGILLGQTALDLSDLPEDTVLVARNLTPSMTAGLKRGSIAGILTEVGGMTSHGAILARAMELPAVLGISGLMEKVTDGDLLILDGGDGTALLNPNEQTLAYYRKRQESFLEARAALSQFVGKPTRTQDGHTVALYGNIGNPEHAEQVMEATGEGVGLFRTEILFMDRESLPTQEEQFEAYRSVVEIMDGREVIIRTLDVGGDKEIAYLGLNKEENPFLGLRGVRFSLAREEMFRTQLRALLRASAFGNLNIMLPMVTQVEELRQVRRLLENVKAELDEQGIAYRRDIKVGVMIETPAAVMLADLLAKEADFFSIGTNDLTQYVMVADRGNQDVSGLGVPFQPAVLRAIRQVIAAGHKAGIRVGMCGEAAADERMIPLLLGFGLDEFSVGPAAILQTRRTIGKWSMEQAVVLTQRVMDCQTLAEVQNCF